MVFKLDGNERAVYYQWHDKHKNECPLYKKDGAIGGRESFVFTPTGLGMIVYVKCGCGKDVDLTNYEEW